MREVTPPFQYFPDADGSPLDGGKIYIGVFGMDAITNPVAAFWDEAMTIPAAQPVPTVNGYPYNTNAPGRIFTAGEYSIVVHNKNDVEIFSADSNADDSAANVTYDPGLTDTVETTVEAKLRQHVTFKDFGAVGNGSTNDAAVVQNAIDALSAGGVIDGQGLTYRCDSTIDGIPSNLRIQNATFNFANVPDIGTTDFMMTASGSLGASHALTLDTLTNTAVVTIASTASFAANDLVFFKSNAAWDSSISQTYSYYARVRTVDSPSQLTLYTNVPLDFKVADTAIIYKVSPVQNVVIDNVRLIGKNGGEQVGLQIKYGENCVVQNSTFDYLNYASVALDRCYKSSIVNCKQKVATFDNVVASYAYAIWSGCYACSVINSWGEVCRHTVTIGGASGINSGINYFTRVIGNHAAASIDAGIDSHSNSMYTEFIGNMVEMTTVQWFTSNHDGIMHQGAHAVIANNTIVGAKGSGIVYQPNFTTSFTGSCKIVGNDITLDKTGFGSGSGGRGVYVVADTSASGNISSILIDGNTIRGGLSNALGTTHIDVYLHKASATFNGLVITNNVSADRGTIGCFVRVDVAATIDRTTVRGNQFKSTNQAMYFFTNNAGAVISNVIGGENIFDSSANFGLYLNAAAGSMTNVRLGRNILYSSGTNIGVAGTVDYILENPDITAPTTFTNATATITPLTNWYIFNRAGTITATLPDATKNTGRILRFKTIQAQAVDSASSNVVPIDSATAGTAILPNTDGSWAQLFCDGTNWVIMAKG